MAWPIWIRSVPPSTRRTSWPSTWPRPSTRKRLARTVKSGSTITISRKWQKFKRFYEEVQDHLQLARTRSESIRLSWDTGSNWMPGARIICIFNEGRLTFAKCSHLILIIWRHFALKMSLPMPMLMRFQSLMINIQNGNLHCVIARLLKWFSHECTTGRATVLKGCHDLVPPCWWWKSFFFWSLQERGNLEMVSWYVDFRINSDVSLTIKERSFV